MSEPTLTEVHGALWRFMRRTASEDEVRMLAALLLQAAFPPTELSDDE